MVVSPHKTTQRQTTVFLHKTTLLPNYSFKKSFLNNFLYRIL